MKHIKVAQTNLVSMSELVGITLEVKSEKVVRFASGEQTYFLVEYKGEEFEVAERFCSAVYYSETLERFVTIPQD
jgi:hypothetical protein